MSESEWLASADPTAMLLYLEDSWRGLTLTPIESSLRSDGKLRLWACGCARALGHVHADAFLFNAELWADTGKEQYESSDCSYVDGFDWCYYLSATAAARMWAGFNGPVSREHRAGMLRCVFGNPWRPPVRVYRADQIIGGVFSSERREEVRKTPWLTPVVLGLARGIYEERAVDRMPILADALEESGCRDEVLLMHCRGFSPCPQCGGAKAVPCKPKPEMMADCSCVSLGTTETPGWFPMKGTHVRGCHVIDLVLGKE